MKNEMCPYEQCRFSRVCNHIHCIRPLCNYVLHSSGQLYSHKRKHERNDSELAYRKHKQLSGGGGGVRGSWSGDDMATQQALALSLNGESSNDERVGSPYFSMDDSFQSGESAIDLTATGLTLPGVPVPPTDNQQLTPMELGEYTYLY